MHTKNIHEKSQFEELIQGLISNDFGCCNNFIDPTTVLGLSTNITQLLLDGNMNDSGIGNSITQNKDKLIRSDKINWIDGLSTNSHELVYLQKIWKFINYLNSTCYTSIKAFESHYSNYAIGNFYKRHLDQFKNEKGRKYSIVLYLNQNWKDEDGGLLSLYPHGKVRQDIAPTGGRLVFFKSDQMEHEVHPSKTRERTSIAGWLKD